MTMTNPKVHGYVTTNRITHERLAMCGKILPPSNNLTLNVAPKELIEDAISFRPEHMTLFNSDITCKKCLAVIEKHKKAMEKVE